MKETINGQELFFLKKTKSFSIEIRDARENLRRGPSPFSKCLDLFFFSSSGCCVVIPRVYYTTAISKKEK